MERNTSILSGDYFENVINEQIALEIQTYVFYKNIK